MTHKSRRPEGCRLLCYPRTTVPVPKGYRDFVRRTEAYEFLCDLTSVPVVQWIERLTPNETM